MSRMPYRSWQELTQGIRDVTAHGLRQAGFQELHTRALSRRRSRAGQARIEWSDGERWLSRGGSSSRGQAHERFATASLQSGVHLGEQPEAQPVVHARRDPVVQRVSAARGQSPGSGGVPDSLSQQRLHTSAPGPRSPGSSLVRSARRRSSWLPACYLLVCSVSQFSIFVLRPAVITPLRMVGVQARSVEGARDGSICRAGREKRARALLALWPLSRSEDLGGHQLILGLEGAVDGSGDQDGDHTRSTGIAAEPVVQDTRFPAGEDEPLVRPGRGPVNTERRVEADARRRHLRLGTGERPRAPVRARVRMMGRWSGPGGEREGGPEGRQGVRCPAYSRPTGQLG
jgi:hypothetical protein